MKIIPISSIILHKIEYLKAEYQVEGAERKAVGRTLERLKDELDIDIMSDNKGSWLDSRTLDDYAGF